MSSSDIDGNTRLGQDAKEHVKDIVGLQKEIVAELPEVAKPNPVASANEGKDGQAAYRPDAPAPGNAETEDSPLLCGPILRYTRQSKEFTVWHGSALIVLSRPAKSSLTFKQPGSEQEQTIDALCIYEQPGRHFYRFDLEINQAEEPIDLPYTIHVEGADTIERSLAIAAKRAAFHILFHSCNGFCDGANEMYKGPTLWKDVMEKHKQTRFELLAGGGDQIYNDEVHAKGAPLHQWSTLDSGRKKAAISFTKELREKVDQWYFNNHVDWFNTEHFRQAVAAIPSVNIWDDHDIIDGMGSYRDKWQRSPVFVGIGEIAWKYMCLFQQHVNPNTTETPDPDAPSGREADHPPYADEPSYVLHPQVGPYIKHRGISIVTSLGAEIVYAGLDCRTDRTQRRICYPETYDALFRRLEEQVVTGQTKHLLVLLGVPIAYPRLVWLETAMASPALVAPLRFLHKTFGMFGSFFNDFDQAAELLDDMQDHWACGLHKKERNRLILRLQEFAKRKKVRVTILSGDVHLAAVGRFYSKKKLNIPQEKDHRYIVNVISSAITNAPPPAAVAQVLNQRNKLHHLDKYTDENLMKIWNVSAHDNSNRLNQTTYPARNYCILRMIGEKEGAYAAAAAHQSQPEQNGSNGHALQNQGSQGSGNSTSSVRAKKVRGTAVDSDLKLRDDGKEISHGPSEAGSLSVCFQIEVSVEEEGKTKPYAFSIPTLQI